MSGYTKSHILEITYDFLFCYCEERDLDQTLERIIQNRNLDKEAFYLANGQTLELFHRMLTDANQKLADFSCDIRYYFGAPDTEKKLEPIIALLTGQSLLQSMRETDLSQHMSRLRNQSMTNWYDQAYKMLSSYNNTIIKSDSGNQTIHSTASLIQYILKMEVEDEVKRKLQDLFLHRMNHLEKVETVFLAVGDFLLTYHRELDELFDRFFTFWNERREGKSLSVFLAEDFIILPAFDDQLERYELVPCLYPLTISLTLPDDKEEETADREFLPSLKVGVFFGPGMMPNTLSVKFNPQANESQALEAIKLLADPSRYAILKYISKEKSYAAEIASHLDLTPATVSHHMGSLYTSSLITPTKENRKLYYQLNHEKLDSFLTHLESQLTTSNED